MSGTMVLNRLSAPVWYKFEPVGYRFHKHVYSMVHGVVSLDCHVIQQDTVGDSSGTEEEEEESDEVNPLLLDPTQWKDQDHYAILGLGKQRYRASQKDIRKAYQQKVLQHHPDKQNNEEDTLFKCIQIAYEILSNPKRKKAFDSVDPTFSDELPKFSGHLQENFYETYGPVFEENARWSNIQPVPLLGQPDDPIEHIEEFYRFWYNFNSWREFSYLDEENTEKAENRDERRWMDKQNKAARLKRKKEETLRIRTLVDSAYSYDPRVKKFKEKEKEERESLRKAKEESLRQENRRKEEEKKKQEEEERRFREKKEEEERRLVAQQKQEREASKRAIKRERKQLRSLCKEKNYFSSNDELKLKRMQEIERLCEILSIESLQSLNQELVSVSEEEGGIVIDREIAIIIKKDEEEEKKMQQARSKMSSIVKRSDGDWSQEETKLLIKAVNLFPAGTVKRWEVIAKYVNDHSPHEGSKEKTSDNVISKVKSLKKLDSTEKEVENKKAYEMFEKQHVLKTGKTVSATPTQRDVSEITVPWTAEEQKKLEQALRTYPSTIPQRWIKIAEMVNSRNKEECIARFKELVAKVKSKKQ